MEVKAAIVADGIIPLLIKLLTGDNGTIVRQASETLSSLCEVSEYRYMAIDSKVFDALTTGMKQISNKDARVAMANAIGAPIRRCFITFTLSRRICFHVCLLVGWFVYLLTFITQNAVDECP